MIIAQFTQTFGDFNPSLLHRIARLFKVTQQPEGMCKRPWREKGRKLGKSRPVSQTGDAHQIGFVCFCFLHAPHPACVVHWE